MNPSKVLSLEGTSRSFYTETALLQLILPQNNHCLLPHYCCSKFCFRWIFWLGQLFARTGTDPSPTSLIAFYWWPYHNEVWGSWAESISLSPSSPPSCGATFGYGQCCSFCFYGWKKRIAAARETPSQPCMSKNAFWHISEQGCLGQTRALNVVLELVRFSLPSLTEVICIHPKQLTPTLSRLGIFFLKCPYLIISAVLFYFH